MSITSSLSTTQHVLPGYMKMLDMGGESKKSSKPYSGLLAGVPCITKQKFLLSS